MFLPIKLAFAGLGPLLLHYGIGVTIIVACIALYLCLQMLPMFLQNIIAPIKQDLIWVAVVVAIALGYGTVIARDMAGRCEAKAAVIGHVVKKAVTDANGNPGVDKWDQNK